MTVQVIPEWMSNLEEEDMIFIKRFILLSGSLKKIARQYEVTYPTVRLRLDKLIQKIELADKFEEDHYVTIIKRLAIDDKIDYETAKILVNEYKKIKEEGSK